MNNLNFDQIYKEYKGEILFHINKKLMFVASAQRLEYCEDILNDSFLKVYKNLSIFDPKRAKFNTWLYTIVNNTIIDYIRKYKTDSKSNSLDISYSDLGLSSSNKVFEVESDVVNADSVLDSTNVLNIILNSINSFKNPIHTKVAKMFFVDELSHEEISEALEIPIGSVKAGIFRAKEILQSELLSLKQNVYA